MTTYWWFRPSIIVMVFIMPLAALAYAAPDQYYLSLGAFNAMTDDEFFVVWLSILGFAGGSYIGEVLITDRMQQRRPHIDEATFRAIWIGLSLLTIAGTIVYLAPILANPGTLFAVFRAEANAAFDVRRQVNQIPGITSLTNLSSLVAILFVLKPRLTGCRRTLGEKILFNMVFILATLRVFAHGERLALIELLIPVLVLVCALKRRSTIWALAPVGGAVALYLFFTATEYLRSWAAFYSTRSDSLLRFAFDRMVGYYLTAVNNGAFVFDQQPVSYLPVRTCVWLWSLPIPGLSRLLSIIAGMPSEPPSLIERIKTNHADVLNHSEVLNPEFNNVAGIFAPLCDFGSLLGILVWVLLGYFSGRLFRSFMKGGWLGLVLFPTWYVGVQSTRRCGVGLDKALR